MGALLDLPFHILPAEDSLRGFLLRANLPEALKSDALLAE
jgi:hypothetical protein